MIAEAFGHATGPWWNHLWFWIEVHTGTVNEAGPYYGWWSGFGSCLGYLAVIGAGAGLIHQHNCHVKRCWRLGGHQVYRPDGAPTPYKVCKTHHPRVDEKRPVTAETVRLASQTTLAQHDIAAELKARAS